MLRRLAILLLVCGGLGFFLQREQGRGTFDPWERRLLTQLRWLHASAPVAPPVVLVELRRGDLPFESWPPAPMDYALVFERLVRHLPRAVVVQPLLAWPDVEPLDAATLSERIALLPRAVLACTLQNSAEGVTETTPPEVPLTRLPGASGEPARVPEFDGPGQVPLEELRAGKALGFTRIEFGEGMTVRGSTVAIPLIARRDHELVSSLVLQALLGWQETPPNDVGVQLGRRLVIGAGLEVPVDAGGRLWISSRLAPPLRRVDAGVLLLDLERDAKLMSERPDELETLRSLEGALVVLGETGENTPRFPVAGSSEGGWTEAEVLARALAASLGGWHLREPPARWQWAGWGAVVLVGACLLASPRRWLMVFAIGGVLALVLGLACAYLNGQWWVAPVPPLALWLAATGVALLLPPSHSATATAAVAPVVAAAAPPQGADDASALPASADSSMNASANEPARVPRDAADTDLDQMLSQLAADETVAEPPEDRGLGPEGGDPRATIARGGRKGHRSRPRQDPGPHPG